jgi:hypothetical protein
VVKKFNRWYNGIREPWRFLTAFAICMPFFLGAAANSIGLILAGFLYAILLICIRIIGV